ncbi:ABC transporter ATP-binding protein [Pelagibius litoralis]|uniref:ABC transporter ATP-binding protein n=1 Tax=Pelagibius litoralis TaxID=374515 RepID=A0A967KDZ1_9PROT|nr:ABC transporter ATP-binding protein [Pelagibius litoralis]NIA71669.1 ABC transporter ATP-binding protein [Pelagibius litoralis]
MRNLLHIRDLRISFNLPEGRLEAVRGVSFRVPAGRTVALVGESGSGKSVVSQAIMGILPRSASIDSGRILLNDPATSSQVIDIASLHPDSQAMRDIRGSRISIIFQEPMTSLSPVHSVGNQICEALHLHRKVSTAEGLSLATEMLRLVGFPDPAKAINTYPFELSGGLRQRAMIAMALVCRPALLIADEPTTALDVTIQAQILKLIKDLQSELGMAVLMITHDLGVVANVADEVVVMYHGEIMESGTLDDIFKAPAHPYLSALLRAVPRFHMKPGERLVPIREIKKRADGAFLAQKAEQAVSADPTILKVEGVTKKFTIRKSGLFGGGKESAVLAVDDVNLTVERGECLGLVGESGCGKTTLSKMIMRALTPDSGSITFTGGRPGDSETDVLALHDKALMNFRTQIQFVFQDPFSSLNPRMTVGEIIAEPLVIHGIGDAADRRKVVEELMGVVGLNRQHIRRYPHSFSGGQRQRIGIARALALRPQLLICDEPVSALDVSIQAQVLNLLKDLKKDLGLTYIFISHNLAVVDYIADRIAVMCQGRLVELAPRESLFRAPAHPYTKALLSAVPEPNPNQRLDLTALMQGRASDPTAWPAPFGIDGEHAMTMVDLGGGHQVRARADAAPELLLCRPQPVLQTSTKV